MCPFHLASSANKIRQTVFLNTHLNGEGVVMRKLPFQQVASKWLKTHIMQQDDKLSYYLPQTIWWQPDHLFDMLQRHTVVFLKPDKGGGGAGIIRIEQIAPRRFEVRYKTKQQRIIGNQSLVSLLKRRMQPGKRYLIQQGIRLKHVAGRPFDIRVIVQKPHYRWQVMGMAAKVAAKEKIVTNRSSGGMALTVPKVLKAGFGWSESQISYVEQLLYRIAQQTAYTLSNRFSGLRVLGLDIGIDEQGRVWIFEVNTRPQFHLFKQTDPARYRQIMRNQRKIVSDGQKRGQAKGLSQKSFSDF